MPSPRALSLSQRAELSAAPPLPVWSWGGHEGSPHFLCSGLNQSRDLDCSLYILSSKEKRKSSSVNHRLIQLSKSTVGITRGQGIRLLCVFITRFCSCSVPTLSLLKVVSIAQVTVGAPWFKITNIFSFNFIKEHVVFGNLFSILVLEFSHQRLSVVLLVTFSFG